MMLSDKVTAEDKEFAMTQIKKCVQLPIDDYIQNYEKFQNKVQNQRNLRSAVPG